VCTRDRNRPGQQSKFLQKCSTRHLAVAIQYVRTGKKVISPNISVLRYNDRHAGSYDPRLIENDGLVPYENSTDIGYGIQRPCRQPAD